MDTYSHILPIATESALVTLLTYHPTMSTLLAVVGVVVIISITIMAISVLLRKKFAKPRPPEKWDRSEIFIMSMFLHAWHRWAVSTCSTTEFNDDDELDVAFDKYVKKLLHIGAIDKYWHGEVLMQALFLHAGHNPSRPFGQFGQDTYSKRMNSKRIEFAGHYAKTLRNMFVDMA